MTIAEGNPAIPAVKVCFAQRVMQELLEAEITKMLLPARGERSDGRFGYRSGYYGRTLITRVARLEVCVRQDRNGRFSTELFERC